MEKLCVILLSYKRQQNIQFIAENILKCSFVDKLIISNSNPEFEIDPWVEIKDPRIEIINHPTKKECHSRWEILKDENFEFYMAIDDDVFLTPEQIKMLFNFQTKDPTRPHGLFGSEWTIEDYEKRTIDRLYSRERDTTVDILHQVYAVSKRHINRYFEIREEILKKAPGIESLLDEHADDLLISHSGTSRPMIHGIGEISECSTRKREGIANCAKDNFKKYRIEAFQHLSEVRDKLSD